MHNIIIIGAGPAGLQASLPFPAIAVHIFVVISFPKINKTRNAPAVHGFLASDGITHAEFYQKAREKIAAYGMANFVDGKMVSTSRSGENFEVKLEEGTQFTGRKLIFAPGSIDLYFQAKGASVMV